jgi:hypothetical protein
MAKSQFAREHIVELALSVLVGLALVGCGVESVAASGAKGAIQSPQAAPFCAAPLEGSPEEVAVARGRCSSRSSYSAPIEGSPEQTAADLGR